MLTCRRSARAARRGGARCPSRTCGCGTDVGAEPPAVDRDTPCRRATRRNGRVDCVRRGEARAARAPDRPHRARAARSRCPATENPPALDQRRATRARAAARGGRHRSCHGPSTTIARRRAGRPTGVGLRSAQAIARRRISTNSGTSHEPRSMVGQRAPLCGGSTMSQWLRQWPSVKYTTSPSPSGRR